MERRWPDFTRMTGRRGSQGKNAMESAPVLEFDGGFFATSLDPKLTNQIQRFIAILPQFQEALLHRFGLFLAVVVDQQI